MMTMTVERNRTSECDIQCSNDMVQKCNATVNAGAASMYTNAVSALFAGTGG